MKKYLFIACALFLGTANAQMSVYNFKHEFGQLTEVDNYPGAIITSHTIHDDIVTPAKLLMPFPFRFENKPVDSIGIAENGYLYFSSLAPLVTASKWPISAVYPAQVTGIIAALGLDLHPVNTATQTTTLKTALVGTAPFRMFIAQWKNASRATALVDAAGPDDITFQIKLYETINRVELAYGSFILNANISEDAEVGLKGATYNDYLNRIPANKNWSASNAGTSQTSRIALNNNSKPDYGTLYVWEPTVATLVKEVSTNNHIALYPIPVKNIMHIKGDEMFLQDARYSITDFSGKIVLSGVISGEALHVNKLTPGFYVLLLSNNGKTIATTFCKAAD